MAAIKRALLAHIADVLVNARNVGFSGGSFVPRPTGLLKPHANRLALPAIVRLNTELTSLCADHQSEGRVD